MKRFEVLFFDADNVCVAQRTVEARNCKGAVAKAQTLEEMGWASVDRYEIEEHAKDQTPAYHRYEHEC